MNDVRIHTQSPSVELVAQKELNFSAPPLGAMVKKAVGPGRAQVERRIHELSEHERISIRARFIELCEQQSSGCWVWKGQINPYRGGYGEFCLCGGRIGAHRAAYLLYHGAIGAGLFVCHKCDNPPCVNPDHLFAGTQRDNKKDAASKGRNLVGVRHPGAKLTDVQVVEIRRLRKAGLTQQSIADQFKIGREQIHYICERKHWKHVP